jgi:hypothetical protein
MGKINIGYMTEAAYNELKHNIGDYREYFLNNPKDSSWVDSLAEGKVFQKKSYQIDDFELEVPSSPNDIDVITRNSILMYEKLSHLPSYILSNKYFWLWFMFKRCYEVALAMMSKKEVSTFENQWLKTGHRGLFFGIISRAYYLVAMTVDENYEKRNEIDRYYLTRFSFEKHSRFRELTWRTFSSNRNIVMGFMKAVYDVVQSGKENTKLYSVLVNDISRLGSIKILDRMMEDDFYSYVYDKYQERLSK